MSVTDDRLRTVIQDVAESRPRANAFLCGQTVLSYRLLTRRMEQFDELLVALGLTSDSVFATLLPASLLSAVLLASSVGQVSVCPLHPSTTDIEFERIARLLNLDVVITTPDRASKLARFCTRTVAAGSEALRLGDFSQLDIESRSSLSAVRDYGNVPAPELDLRPSIIVATSGTTGLPKLVPLSAELLCRGARKIGRVLDLSEEDTSVGSMELCYSHGLLASVMAPLASGGTSLLTQGADPLATFRALSAHRATWCTSVPTFLESLSLAAQVTGSANSLRVLRTTGAALSPRLRSKLSETFDIPLVEAYAMSESPGHLTSNPLPPGKVKAGTVGFDEEGIVAIHDDDGRAVPAGSVGTIVLARERTISRYIGAAPADAARLGSRWFDTGDRGSVDDDGYLTLMGRQSDIINRGGQKVSAWEVETAISQHPLVREVAVFGVPHQSLGEIVGSAVVVDDPTHCDSKHLVSFLSGHLSPYKIPDKWYFSDALARTRNGKIDRGGVRAWAVPGESK